MADTFFGFDTTLADGNLEEELECPLEDEVAEEEEYDALNDETFGSEATIGDWEKDHEKLAELTESSRPQHQNDTSQNNKVNTDIADSLSHLVLDDTQGIIPRPGVWDSPANLSLPKPQLPLPLTNTLKNACTVEELERCLISNRPPPGLTKPVQSQQRQQKGDGSMLFDALSINDKLQINGLPPVPRFLPPGLPAMPGPHPVLMHPNMRLPYSQFMQNPRLLTNQNVNVLRYPLPPRLMIPPGPQRQPPHGVFGNNFPQPPHPGLGPHQFLRPEHGMIPNFPRDQSNQQHNFPHLGMQKQQNRSFHHNDQPGNHHPFFKNNQYLHQNHNRNNQRHHQYQHSPHGMNGINGTNGAGDYDEYAGLMSNREKQWLINIQLLQLNTNQSYVDDYYYTVFCDRQNKKNQDPTQKLSKDRVHHNNNGFNKDSRDKDHPQLTVTTKVVYTPLQFENSLGKLQCGSVTAPRKIIDMDVMSNNEPQSTNVSQQKDSKKTRQLLLEIERLYTIQLKLEDLSNPLALLSEQQQQETEGETPVVKKTAPELISSMFTSLLQLHQDEKFASMLGIRKGKMLLLRFLPRVDVKEYSEQLGELWIGIMRGLAVIGRRDGHLMPNFYPQFRSWLETVTDFDVLLRLARALSDTVSQTARHNSLAFALTNKFGVSVIASVITQVEKLHPSDELLSERWAAFILAIEQNIKNSLPNVKPYDPITESTLERHLKRITHFKTERYDALANLLID